MSNRKVYFLIAIFAMILAVGWLILSPSSDTNQSVNITFRGDSKLGGPETLVFEDMNATVDRGSGRRLKVAKYKDKTQMKAVSTTGLISYVDGGLSLMSSSTQPRVALSMSNQQTYRRYVVDNSQGQVVANIAGYQQIQLHNSASVMQGGVVQIGNTMAAQYSVDDCPHTNVNWGWSEEDGLFGTCTDCNGKGTMTDSDGDGIIDADGMEWVPVGDAVLPMLLLALGYLLYLRRRK